MRLKTMIARTALSIIAITCLSVTSASALDDKAADRQAKLEQEFSQRMSNTVLVGSFTIDGKDKPPADERYEIEKVEKLDGNMWVFTVRIKYGKTDVKLPITVPVVWADETPMVSLTNFSFPGLGSGFSARVLFHGDRYAGTWQHNAVGGCMFGRIEKPKAKEQPKKPASTDSSKP